MAYRRKVSSASAAILSISLMVVGMIYGNQAGIAIWILSTPVVFWCGKQFFSNAWKQLRHRMCSMDTLVALSSGVSYLFSIFNLTFPSFWSSKGIEPHLYFEASAMVVTFVLIGKLLESNAKRQTTTAVRKLIGLKPRTVTLVDGNEEKSVDVETIKPGDIIAAHPGERIAVDGSRIKVNAGSDRFMSMLGVNIPETLTRKASSMHGTLIWFSEDGEVSAVLAVSDQVRNTAKEGIELLKNMGIDTYILTGDRKEEAANAAFELGVKSIRAEALPSDKVEFIRSIQSSGIKTAMVGDGINDSAAMALSSISVVSNSLRLKFRKL